MSKEQTTTEVLNEDVLEEVTTVVTNVEEVLAEEKSIADADIDLEEEAVIAPSAPAAPSAESPSKMDLARVVYARIQAANPAAPRKDYIKAFKAECDMGDAYAATAYAKIHGPAKK